MVEKYVPEKSPLKPTMIWNVVKHLPKKRAQVAQLRWLRPKTFKKS